MVQIKIKKVWKSVTKKRYQNSNPLTKMKMCDNETINVRRVRSCFSQIREVWEFPVVLVTHVHATIQHNVLATQSNHNATAANILARP